MPLVQAQLASHAPGHLAAVAGEHDGLRHALRLQRGNGSSAVALHLVIYNNVSGILAVHSHVDDGALVAMVALMPLRADAVHHLRVAHAHHAATHAGTDALASHLRHVAHHTAVGGLVGEGIAQRGPYGVGAVVLHMGRQVQQLVRAVAVGVYGLHHKLAMGQRARLVEHHGAHAGQHVHVVGTLHQDAAARGSADAGKERQRHADDQRTGTADHQEHQRTVEPGDERFAE